MQNPTICTKGSVCESSRGEVISNTKSVDMCVSCIDVTAQSNLIDETAIREALKLCRTCNYPNKFEDCTSFIDLNMQLSKVISASR